MQNYILVWDINEIGKIIIIIIIKTKTSWGMGTLRAKMTASLQLRRGILVLILTFMFLIMFDTRGIESLIRKQGPDFLYEGVLILS